MNKKFLFTGIILLSLSLTLNAGVWKTVYADVDGDGSDEPISYVIGSPGEENIPYVYYPIDFVAAWETSRTHSGIFSIRQIIRNENNILLDTGYPELVGDDTLVYFNTYYNSWNNYTEGENIVSIWESDLVVLKRIANLDGERCVVKYEIYQKDDSNNNLIGKTGLIIVWNDGKSSITEAENYVDQKMNYYNTLYSDSFSISGGTGRITFNVSDQFDDYMSKVDDYSVIGWDGWQSTSPGTPTIFGMIHLPLPDTLSTSYSTSARVEVTSAIWKFQEVSVIAANIRIEPEVINLNSHGKFTAFITLPEEYNVNDINLSTIVCEGAHAVDTHISDDGNTLIAKFWVQDLSGVQVGSNVEMKVFGEMYDGTPFAGSDNVRIIDKGMPQRRRRIIAMSISPNPFVNSTTIECKVSSISVGFPSHPLLEIYNTAGQLVKRVVLPNAILGSYKFNWDRKDISGRRVASGVYIYKIRAGNLSKTGKLIALP